MERIEFSELTSRLHRNMVGSAAIIVGIVFFDLRIERFAASGIELKNFTTGILLKILIGFLVYHSIAFAIRAFEEFRIWELKLAEKPASFLGGGVGVIGLADQLQSLSELMNKLMEHKGPITIEGKSILNKYNVEDLNEVSKTAQIYAKRFKNFPAITRLRFWVWDIGVAVMLTFIALLFAVSFLTGGR